MICKVQARFLPDTATEILSKLIDGTVENQK